MAQIMSAGLDASTNLFPIFFVEDVAWRSLWLVLVSVAIVLGMSSASNVSSLPTPRSQPPSPPPRLATGRVRLAQAAADRRVEAQRHQTRQGWSKQGFPFRRLPPELQLTVLSYCSDSRPTYRSLIHVSRYMYFSTLRACLPRMPITLLTTKELSSFALLVQKQFHHADDYHRIGSLVRYLWISPIRESDDRFGQIVLRTCTNVEVLACDSTLLNLVVASARRHKHKACRELTIFLASPQWEVSLLAKPTGREFLGQLTHLRVMGERMVPRSSGFWKLTHLSYYDFPKASECSEEEEETTATPWMVDDPQLTFPSLRHVVLTKRCGPELQPAESLGKMLTVRHVLRDSAEIGLWKETVGGNGIWGAIAEAAKRPRKSPKDAKRKPVTEHYRGVIPSIATSNTRSL